MMNTSLRNQSRSRAHSGVSLLAAIIALSGCATTEPSRTPASIEITEAVGFTIKEETRINNDVRVDYDEAVTQLEQGRLEHGVELLEAVVAAAPELSAPRIDLSIAYHRSGNLAAAESELLKAIESNPDHPIALNELGIVYRKTGRFTEARKSYQAALAIYPGYHYARRNLAVLCDLYLTDLNCALDNYEAYMTTVVSDDETAMWISDIRQRMGQVEE